MATLVSFYQAHAVFISLVLAYAWSALIGSLPAPTATSSSLYVFLFKFLNVFAANLSRAANTTVESSPNFTPAVAIRNAAQGTVTGKAS